MAGKTGLSTGTATVLAVYVLAAALAVGLLAWGITLFALEHDTIEASKGIARTCVITELSTTYDGTCDSVWNCRGTFRIAYSYTDADVLIKTDWQDVPNDPTFTELSVGDNIDCYGANNVAFLQGWRLAVYPLWWYTPKAQAVLGVGGSLAGILAGFLLYGAFVAKK